MTSFCLIICYEMEKTRAVACSEIYLGREAVAHHQKEINVKHINMRNRVLLFSMFLSPNPISVQHWKYLSGIIQTNNEAVIDILCILKSSNTKATAVQA